MTETKDTIAGSLTELKWDNRGLIPVITQEAGTGIILMQAWMDQEALDHTIETRVMHYWSRSRKALWRKGETSGHEQHVVSIMADCDNDCLLATVHQTGVACHTGRKSCFFHTIILPEEDS